MARYIKKHWIAFFILVLCTAAIAGTVISTGRAGPFYRSCGAQWALIDAAFVTDRGRLTAIELKSDLVTNATTSAGAKIQLAEGTTNGTSVVILQAPAALGDDRTIDVPDADVILANIAVNTTHTTGDGSDHADVAMNTAAIAIRLVKAKECTISVVIDGSIDDYQFDDSQENVTE